MIAWQLASLAATILVVYAALLAVYFGSCLVIGWLNRKRLKIQPGRDTPVALIRRDRRQSIVSLAGISAMFGVGHWAYVSLGWGYAAWPTNLWSVPLSLLASLVLFDAWFYWLHRLIHTRPLYAKVHRWHHMTVTPVAWSNNSDRLVDNLFLQSYWLVAHFLIPVAPAVLIAHKIYDQITGVVGHSGYEYAGRSCLPPSPLVGVTHHDQHHRYFRCNYATHFTFWDRLMGTLHPDYDSELARNIAGASKLQHVDQQGFD